MDKPPYPFTVTPFLRLTLFSLCLTFCVIVLGTYTRLTDAGLGCPDWPGCYGQWIAPMPAFNDSVDDVAPLFSYKMQGSIDPKKAWTEMAHRYLAGSLGIALLALAILAIRQRHHPRQPILVPILLLVIVIFQSVLGMWTVTLKLCPLVVMAHLTGGMTILSLLWWLALAQNAPCIFWKCEKTTSSKRRLLKISAILTLTLLIAQIALGGWTSSNYAALVCLDFPFCNLNAPIIYRFSEAFDSLSLTHLHSFETPLRHSERVAMHMLHRINAAFTAIAVIGFAVLTFYHTSNRFIRSVAIMTIVCLIIQILLGITNIIALLPLTVAIAHNATAALLLILVLTLTHYAYQK